MKTIFIVTKIIKVKLYKYILKNKLPVTLKGQTKIVCTSGSGCTGFLKIQLCCIIMMEVKCCMWGIELCIKVTFLHDLILDVLNHNSAIHRDSYMADNIILIQRINVQDYTDTDFDSLFASQ